MGHNSVVSSYPISTSFPRVDGWSTNPRVMGHHNNSSLDWSTICVPTSFKRLSPRWIFFNFNIIYRIQRSPSLFNFFLPVTLGSKSLELIGVPSQFCYAPNPGVR